MPKVMPKPTTASFSPTSPQVLMTSAGRAWSGLDADFVHVPRGMSHAPESEFAPSRYTFRTARES